MYALLTHHGTFLCYDESSDSLFHCSAYDADSKNLVYLRTVSDNRFYFGRRNGGKKMNIYPIENGLTNPSKFAKFEIVRPDESGKLSFRESGNFLSAHSEGHAAFDVSHCREWEYYTPIKQFLDNNAINNCFYDNFSVCVIQPVFVPTKGQFDRNIRSIRSMARYFESFPFKNINFKFSGWGKEPFITEISSLIEEVFSCYNFNISILNRNHGKAFIVNKVVSDIIKENYRPDFLFLCDSDIIFAPMCYNIVERLCDVAIMSPRFVEKPFGLVALTQIEGNCHILSDCRKNSYSFMNRFGEIERIVYPSNPSGIAGGCLFCNFEAWTAANGYREMGVYAGDDAFLLLDIANNGFSYQLSEDIFIVHPPDGDQEYARWKYEVCRRDSDGATDKKLDDIIKESELFWEKM